MPDIPPCLQRRYQAFDNLCADLRACCESPEIITEESQTNRCEDQEIKLMCQLWNIQHSDIDSREADKSLENKNKKTNDHLNTQTQVASTSRVTCFVANAPVRNNERNGNRCDTDNVISLNRQPRHRSFSGSPDKRSGRRNRTPTPEPQLQSSTATRSIKRSSQTNSHSFEQIPQQNKQPQTDSIKTRDLGIASASDALAKDENNLFIKDVQEKPDRPLCCETCDQCFDEPDETNKVKPQKDSSHAANWSLKPLKSESLQSGYKSDRNDKVMHSAKSPKSKPRSKSDPLSLDKVLNNVSEAEEYDRKTEKRLKELAEKERMLKQKIEVLENKEKDGLQLLKQADCIWHSMEQDYKKRLADSQERQKILADELQQVDRCVAKWRKNFNDMQLKLSDIAKCEKEIAEKRKQKEHDAACLEVEIKNLKTRIEKTKKSTEAATKSFEFNKVVNTKKIANYNSEISDLQKELIKERTHRRKKELEGEHSVKKAREDLTNLSRLLLNKKLENDDLRAQQEDVIKQTELIKQTSEQYKEKTELKIKAINAEITKIETAIANQNFKCLRCHQYTDTEEMRKLCADCPRCQFEADGDNFDCVCEGVKRTFLNNVFENMSSVLENKAQTASGKAAADAILKCLRNSKNGKLDDETRMILQEFILTTLKQNLDLTIVGGAAKTKCEMEPEIYKQLMLCINNIKPIPVEVDKEMKKKDPCHRWGGECHCNKGPENCICKVKGPPAPPKRNKDPKKDKKDTQKNRMKREDVPSSAKMTAKKMISKDKEGKCDDQSCCTTIINVKRDEPSEAMGVARAEQPFTFKSSKENKQVLDKSASPFGFHTSVEDSTNRESVIEEIFGKIEFVEVGSSPDDTVHSSMVRLLSDESYEKM